MQDLQQQLAVLAARVDAGFAAERRIFESYSRQQDENHAENRDSMQRIEAQVKETNGRVTRHDEQLITLFKVLSGGRSSLLTLEAALRYIAVFSAGGAAVYWVIKSVLGWHP